MWNFRAAHKRPAMWAVGAVDAQEISGVSLVCDVLTDRLQGAQTVKQWIARDCRLGA